MKRSHITKKTICLFLIAAILLPVLSEGMSVAASEILYEYEVQGVHYVLTEDGTFTVSGEGEMKNSYTHDWDDYRDLITSVVIGEGITTVDLFDKCENLQSVTLSDSVTEIGGGAFSGCVSLTNLELPDGLKTIGDEAFSDSGLVEVVLPDGLETIGIGAFSGCSGLTEVVLPDSVTNIGQAAFRDCESLVKVTVGAGVTELGDMLFENDTSLRYMILPEGLTKIGTDTFSGCVSLQSIDLPDSLTHIGQAAFAGTGLTSVTIPDGVEILYTLTFSDCDSLTDVQIGSGVTAIARYAFCSCDSLKSIVIPDNVLRIHNEAFQFCNQLKWISLGKNFSFTGGDMFRYCDGLTDIYYAGSKEDWEAEERNAESEDKTDVTIHYNSTGPDDTGEDPSDPAAAQVFINDISFERCDALTGTWTSDYDTLCTGDTVRFSVELTAPQDAELSFDVSNYACADEYGLGSSAVAYDSSSLTVTETESGEETIYLVSICATLCDEGSYTLSFLAEGASEVSVQIEVEAAALYHVVSMTPACGDTEVELGTITYNYLELEIVFDQEIELGEGTVSVCNYETGEVYRTISVNDDNGMDLLAVSSESPNTLWIEFASSAQRTVTAFGAAKDVTCIPYDTKLCILIEENTVLMKETGDSFAIDDREVWNFTTEWGLTADVDLLPFTNDEEWYQTEHYQISDSIFDYLEEYATHPFAKMEILIDRYQTKWTGSCFGMSAVTVLAKMGKLDLSAWAIGSGGRSVSVPADAAIPADSTWDFGTMDLVNYYHLLQNILAVNDSNNYNILQLSSRLKEAAEHAAAIPEEGPFLLRIACTDPATKETYIHALAATGYRVESETIILEVYDCNQYLSGEIKIATSNGTPTGATYGDDYKVTALKYISPDILDPYNIDAEVAGEDKIEYGVDDPGDILDSGDLTELSGGGNTVSLLSAEMQTVDLSEAEEQDSDAGKVDTILSFAGSGNFLITNAAGETISCTDGEISYTMNIYGSDLVGDGEDFKYVVYTDASTSFTCETEDESALLTVYQDGVYVNVSAVGKTEQIVISPGSTASVEAADAVEYAVHVMSESFGEALVAVTGTSEGTVTFQYAAEEMEVTADALSNTVVRYYDMEGSEPTDLAVEDAVGGILVDRYGGGARAMAQLSEEPLGGTQTWVWTALLAGSGAVCFLILVMILILVVRKRKKQN